jgi:hypothetical protein
MIRLLTPRELNTSTNLTKIRANTAAHAHTHTPGVSGCGGLLRECPQHHGTRARLPPVVKAWFKRCKSGSASASKSERHSFAVRTTAQYVYIRDSAPGPTHKTRRSSRQQEKERGQEQKQEYNKNHSKQQQCNNNVTTVVTTANSSSKSESRRFAPPDN